MTQSTTDSPTPTTDPSAQAEAWLDEFDRALSAGDSRAAAAMFTDEIGYPPYHGSPRGYRSLIAQLIKVGHTYVWVDDGEVVFKAELSAWTPEVVQIQGVYTAPKYRNKGIAGAGLAAVCTQVFNEVPRCSLYVNQYNVIAQRVYERLGFRTADVFATVMY